MFKTPSQLNQEVSTPVLMGKRLKMGLPGKETVESLHWYISISCLREEREREMERREHMTMGLKGCLQEWLLTLRPKKNYKKLNLSL